MTSLADVAEEARRITAATDLPLLVDCDTGWGSSLMIARTVREMTRAGVARQFTWKTRSTANVADTGPGKQLVPAAVMVDRLKAAVDARSDPQLSIMARTDAAAVEGLDAAIARAVQYVEAAPT